MPEQKQPGWLHRQKHDVDSAAKLVDCHPETIRRAIKAGELTAYRPSKSVVIFEDDLELWMKSRIVRPRRKRGQRGSRDPRAFNLR